MYARDTVKKLLKWSLCDLMKAFIGDMREREQTEVSGRAQGQGIRLNKANRQDQSVKGEDRRDREQTGHSEERTGVSGRREPWGGSMLP